MRSSVLVIGHPEPDKLTLGADTAPDHSTALSLLRDNPYQVVAFALPPGEEQESLGFVEDLVRLAPEAQKVLVCPSKSGAEVLKVLKKTSLCQVVSDFLEPEFEGGLKLAMEDYALSQQGLDLFRLFHDQNAKLRSLQENLEQRVLKRQQYLSRTKSKLEKTRRQMEALHAALLGIQGASSLSDLERALSESLGSYLQLAWARILFNSQSSLPEQISSQQLKEKIYEVPLSNAVQELGKIYYARPAEAEDFTRDEKEFLQQLSEAITLAIERLIQMDQAESLKLQWEATFNAISAPLCLVDRSFKILRSNLALSKALSQPDKTLLGQSILKLIFPQITDAEIGRLSPRFRLRRQDELSQRTYDISCQPLNENSLSDSVSIFICRDLTEQLALERQVLESTKMAELGTIGSSIAHELNNPIGGMLNFLQLIKMSLTDKDPLREDIEAMEKAAHRCRDIVHNLLGFARHHDLTEAQTFSVQDLIHQALKIIEIKARYQDVVFELDLPPDPILVYGQPQLLTQAVKNILSNAVEAVTEASPSSPKVIIRLRSHKDSHELTISDNGPGISEENLPRIFNPLFTTKNPNLHPGLGLTVAYKIISEHQGKLEILSQTGVGVTAKITLKRPDSTSTPQVFDGKI